MNNLPENINQDKIVAYLNGETTIEETLVINEWINLSDSNKKHIDELRLLWEQSGKLDPAPIDVDTNLAWQKLLSRIDKKDKKTIPIKVKENLNRFSIFYKIAAVLISVIILSYYYISQNTQKSEILVSVSQTIQKTLADGSIISLNKNSKLFYPETFKGSKREVVLEGEAFFTITSNKEKPFIIHVSNVDVKVVGTSFNVKEIKDSGLVEVFVKTGKVMLYAINCNDSDILVLEAGTKGIFNSISKKGRKIISTDENDIFWKTKSLVFNKTSISDVVAQLNKNYNVTINIIDNKILNCHLTAQFNEQSIDSILEVIATTLNLKITKSGSRYEINGEGC